MDFPHTQHVDHCDTLNPQFLWHNLMLHGGASNGVSIEQGTCVYLLSGKGVLQCCGVGNRHEAGPGSKIDTWRQTNHVITNVHGIEICPGVLLTTGDVLLTTEIPIPTMYPGA